MMEVGENWKGYPGYLMPVVNMVSLSVIDSVSDMSVHR